MASHTTAVPFSPSTRKTGASPGLSLIFLVFFLGLFTNTASFASGTTPNPIAIGNYTLVSVSPAGGKNYDFAYRATATNKGKTALSSLVMALTAACKTSFNAIDGEISFGPIALGKSATSTENISKCGLFMQLTYLLDYGSSLFTFIVLPNGTGFATMGEIVRIENAESAMKGLAVRFIHSRLIPVLSA
jgi:hypothetical protein